VANNYDTEEGNLAISSMHYKLMDKALAQMPHTDRGMYTDTLRRVSEEVRRAEINPDGFLRVENLNCSKAAERLIRYLKLRTKTFGKKKYFLALDQTGDGALERKELAALGTGFINLLPNDRDGCPVIFIDSLRCRQRDTQETVRKCFFYMFSLLAENTQSQQAGATLLYYVHNVDQQVLRFLQQLADALPIRFKAVHLLSLRKLPSNLKLQIKFAGEVNVHVAGTKALLGAALEARGFEKAKLPTRLNGEWGYDTFVHWQELRTRFEWKIPAGLSGRSQLAGEFDFSTIRPFSALSEEEKPERQRRMNVVHSRRKRDRERVEIDVLQEDCMDHKERKKKLRRENEELEGLYEKAMDLIRNTSSPSPTH
jgi:hypothetical protein